MLISTANHVQFVHDGGEAAPAFSIQADDGSNLSNTLAGDVFFANVNDAPVLDLNSSNDPSISTGYSAPLFNDGNAFPIAAAPVVTDIDSATLAGATVILTDGQEGDYFTLGSTDSTGTLPSGIQWTISGFAGNAADPLKITFSGAFSPSTSPQPSSR